jgi:DNA-binding NarL/FixJ family response regulator
MTEPYRVLVIAASVLVREGIKAVLESNRHIVCTTAPNAVLGGRTAASIPIQLIVLCMSLSVTRLCEITSRWIRKRPTAPVVVVTESCRQRSLLRLADAGAAAHVLLSEADRCLVSTVLSVARGDRPLRDLASEVPDSFPGGLTAENPDLSPREREMPELLGAGWSNARIARQLELAGQSVRNLVAQVYNKLDVHTRAEAVVWAREHGFGME